MQVKGGMEPISRVTTKLELITSAEKLHGDFRAHLMVRPCTDGLGRQLQIS
jgi:hypothetical protein